jgi:polysaccharide export outer membrane protein
MNTRTFRTSCCRIAVVALAATIGCAPPHATPSQATAAPRTGAAMATRAVAPAVAPAAPSADAPTAGSMDTSSPESVARLADLARARHGEAGERDYVVGPGDVLSVRAFDLNDLNQRVRVDGNGTISLPLLNTVPVAGHTVGEVEKDLTKRLGEFMYNPHVSVFIEEYRSQQVAVVGAVQHPGLVSQTAASSTVLDALSAAGGMTADAGSRIYLIPAESRAEPRGAMLATAATSNDPGLMEGVGLRDAAPLFVDTKEASPQGQRLFFSLPVRGGDVILVPRTGHFIAEGWVEKPGTYPLQSGLTLRGALAIAGGLSFPADTGSIRIFRAQASGSPELHEVNYGEVMAQRAPDMVIQEGDVIEVATSTAKMVPYGVYKTVTEILHLGARIPLIP